MCDFLWVSRDAKCQHWGHSDQNQYANKHCAWGTCKNDSRYPRSEQKIKKAISFLSFAFLRLRDSPRRESGELNRVIEIMVLNARKTFLSVVSTLLEKIWPNKGIPRPNVCNNKWGKCKFLCFSNFLFVLLCVQAHLSTLNNLIQQAKRLQRKRKPPKMCVKNQKTNSKRQRITKTHIHCWSFIHLLSAKQKERKFQQFIHFSIRKNLAIEMKTAQKQVPEEVTMNMHKQTLLLERSKRGEY